MLSKICLRTVQNFSKLRMVSDYDTGNMMGLVDCPPKATLTLWEKFTSLSPSNLYTGLD